MVESRRSGAGDMTLERRAVAYMGGWADWFGMTQRPMMMGPGGMVGPHGVGDPEETGPRESEWLTMSL